jgi:hypothetical protein
VSPKSATKFEPFRALAALLVALGSASVVSDAHAQSKAEGATIVRGQARVRDEGARDWRPSTPTDILSAGMSVQATDSPLEMKLPDGVAVTLEPGATAEWMPRTKLPCETNRWTRGFHLVLQDGEIEVHMPPAPKGTHAFLVSTKAGTLTEWRGQLHLEVQGDSAAAAIYEGALVIGSNGQGFPVHDGAAIVMRRGQNPDKTRGIPSSPTWSGDDQPFAVALGANDPGMDVSWNPDPRATGYRVEIATDPAMFHVVERATIHDPHYHAAVKGAASERYWAHVRTFTRDGIVGNWTSPKPLRVLHLELPPDGFVAKDGTVVMAKGTSLRLPVAEHVEVAYENVASLARTQSVPLYWSKLTGPLRLGEEMPLRIVHLRDLESGSSGEVRLVLARRELRARVALSPSGARWPVDPIKARIEVSDPSGRIDVNSAGVFVETMLDLTPLPVRWEHTGSTWTGQIAPRLIADPSVLRIIVKDGLGAEIGRGFLELAPAQQGSSEQTGELRLSKAPRFN